MRKSQIALGKRWKWHFQASRFQNFLGEQLPPHPHTPLVPRASGARVSPPPTYITLATALHRVLIKSV